MVGGVPQLSVAGANDFTDAVGTGIIFTGAAGTAAFGLSFQISNLTDGSYGTISLTTGVAASLEAIIDNLVETSQGGALAAEIDTLTDTIGDFDDRIEQREERLVLFEDNLRQRFVSLEVLLAQLDSQRQAFERSISSLNNIFSRN